MEQDLSDTQCMEWLARNMRSLWQGRERQYRSTRGDYRLPDIGLVESEKDSCSVEDLRLHIKQLILEEKGETQCPSGS
jgi:hypothetical protein